MFLFFFRKEKSWQHSILYRGLRFWGLMHRFYMICLHFPAKVARRAICRWCAGRSAGMMEWFKWLLFCHKWLTCSPSTQDFLGQAHFTLGEVVGSLGSRSEKALGWVGVSAAWILISNYQDHCCSPEPVQHVWGVTLQKVAVWKETMNWGCKRTTTLCSPGWRDSLPPAAILRRAADSKLLPVCGAMWSSSLLHIQCCEFELIRDNLVSF